MTRGNRRKERKADLVEILFCSDPSLSITNIHLGEFSEKERGTLGHILVSVKRNCGSLLNSPEMGDSSDSDTSGTGTVRARQNPRSSGVRRSKRIADAKRRRGLEKGSRKKTRRSQKD